MHGVAQKYPTSRWPWGNQEIDWHINLKELQPYYSHYKHCANETQTSTLKFSQTIPHVCHISIRKGKESTLECYSKANMVVGYREKKLVISSTSTRLSKHKSRCNIKN